MPIRIRVSFRLMFLHVLYIQFIGPAMTDGQMDRTTRFRKCVIIPFRFLSNGLYFKKVWVYIQSNCNFLFLVVLHRSAPIAHQGVSGHSRSMCNLPRGLFSLFPVPVRPLPLLVR